MSAPRHLESAAQIVPDRDAEFIASLGEAQKSIAAVTADVAAGPGADLAPGDLAADIVLRAVDVQRGLGTVQHHQQLIFVGMQPYQQAIQGDEARAAEKDAVEPGAQGDRAALAWFARITFRVGIERQDQAAAPRCAARCWS